MPDWIEGFVPDEDGAILPRRYEFGVISRGAYTDRAGNKIRMIATTRPEIRTGTMREDAGKILEALG